MNKPNQNSAPQSNRRRRAILFRLAAVGLACLPFVVLEIGLRAAGVAPPTQQPDPLVGFSEINPLFERKGDRYQTSRARGLFFGNQEFAAKKPENGFRIFSLGGSTVRGRPYETDSSFTTWLQLELGRRAASRKIESVNCGGLSYASYRLNLILDEVLNYEPDLIVIATGHNEFLEDRTYAEIKQRSWLRKTVENRIASLHSVNLLRGMFVGKATLEPELGNTQDADSRNRSNRTTLGGEVKERLTDPNGYASYHRDSQWSNAVRDHFELSVRTMLEKCKVRDVPVILINLSANLRDTPPFKSELSAGLSASDQQAWTKAFESASDIDLQNPEKALDHYQAAFAIDAKHALLRYRMARCLSRMGKHEQAKTHFHAAKNLDICPLRIHDSMRDQIDQIARDQQVPCVDLKPLLMSPHDTPGSDWFTDHVHPTIDGHQRLAAAIAQKIAELEILKPLAPLDPKDRQSLYEEHLTSLGVAFIANGRERVGWLESWAQRNRLYEESLPSDARGNLYRGMRRCGFGETDEAWQDFELALHEQPSLRQELDAYLDRLDRQGSPQLAAPIRERLAKP